MLCLGVLALIVSLSGFGIAITKCCCPHDSQQQQQQQQQQQGQTSQTKTQSQSQAQAHHLEEAQSSVNPSVPQWVEMGTSSGTGATGGISTI